MDELTEIDVAFVLIQLSHNDFRRVKVHSNRWHCISLMKSRSTCHIKDQMQAIESERKEKQKERKIWKDNVHTML